MDHASIQIKMRTGHENNTLNLMNSTRFSFINSLCTVRTFWKVIILKIVHSAKIVNFIFELKKKKMISHVNGFHSMACCVVFFSSIDFNECGFLWYLSNQQIWWENTNVYDVESIDMIWNVQQNDSNRIAKKSIEMIICVHKTTSKPMAHLAIV